MRRASAPRAGSSPSLAAEAAPTAPLRPAPVRLFLPVHLPDAASDARCSRSGETSSPLSSYRIRVKTPLAGHLWAAAKREPPWAGEPRETGEPAGSRWARTGKRSAPPPTSRAGLTAPQPDSVSGPPGQTTARMKTAGSGGGAGCGSAMPGCAASGSQTVTGRLDRGSVERDLDEPAAPSCRHPEAISPISPIVPISSRGRAFQDD